MKRLVPVVAVCLAACGGGGDKEAEAPKTEQLTKADKCLRDANVKQTPPIDAPERIDVAHIIVKHDQVKGAIKEDIIRTREEACLRAQEARDFLLSSSDWDAGYKKYTDGGGATEGVLSNISQVDVEPAFANAAFSIGVNELSHVVETKRGFHIILRQR
jgi:parvulin-like peptidyl-prolyl isomerase